MQFKHLLTGDTFDFIGPDRMYNSFYLRCEKISDRKYKDETGQEHQVGSTNAEVFHVKMSLPRPVAD